MNTEMSVQNLFTDIAAEESAIVNGGVVAPGAVPTAFNVQAYLQLLGDVVGFPGLIPANSRLSPGGVAVRFEEELLAWELALT